MIGKRIRRILSVDEIARSISVLVGGTVLAQGLLFISAPLLTRLYTPEDFGVLAVYSSVLAILSDIAGLRYNFAIPLPASDREGASLVVVSTAAVTLIAAIVLVIGLYIEGIFEVAGLSAVQSYWYFLPLGVAGSGYYSTLNYWAIREKNFPTIARTRMSQAGASALTQIGLGVIGLGPAGLLTGHLIGTTAGIRRLAASIRRHGEIFRTVSFTTIVDSAVRYIRFPLVSTWGTLMNSAGLYVPAIALASIYGPTVAGWFALADRIVRLPLTLVGNSAAQVYVGEAAETMRRNPNRMRPLFKSFAIRLAGVGAIPAVTIALFGPDLFQVMFGADWSTSGIFAQALVLAFFLRLVASPLSQTLSVLERQGTQLIWEGGRLLSVLAVFWLAGTREWSPELCVLVYSAAMAASYGVIVVIGWMALPAVDRGLNVDGDNTSEVKASSEAWEGE